MLLKPCFVTPLTYTLCSSLYTSQIIPHKRWTELTALLWGLNPCIPIKCRSLRVPHKNQRRAVVWVEYRHFLALWVRDTSEGLQGCQLYLQCVRWWKPWGSGFSLENDFTRVVKQVSNLLRSPIRWDESGMPNIPHKGQPLTARELETRAWQFPGKEGNCKVIFRARRGQLLSLLPRLS